jgi:predicted MPP superfamily phosphohydrolase
MLLLFLGACLGHLVLMIAHHNWWYGQRLPRQAGKVIHLVHGILIVWFPIFLWRSWGPELTGLFVFGSDPLWPPTAQEFWAGYVVLCNIAAFVLLPANLAARHLRRDPSEPRPSRFIDVPKELGYLPAGRGKHRVFGYLPGNEIFQLELAERTLFLPRLPAAWDGLTMLHLSDLHFHGTPDRNWYRFVVDRCAEWEPDLVAITGDISDSFHHVKWTIPVLGRLRWKIAAFAILGNHDFWYEPNLVRRRLRRLRMHVLPNTWEQIDIRGEPLVVIGQEAPWLRPSPDLRDCPTGPFRLCLSHTPDNICWARCHRIDLMLSGHVHGGQIRFPVVGSVLLPSAYGRRYDCGAFAEGPTLLHVSRGLSGQHPLRYGCRPEVTLLTLRPREDQR